MLRSIILASLLPAAFSASLSAAHPLATAQRLLDNARAELLQAPEDRRKWDLQSVEQLQKQINFLQRLTPDGVTFEWDRVDWETLGASEQSQWVRWRVRRGEIRDALLKVKHTPGGISIDEALSTTASELLRMGKLADARTVIDAMREQGGESAQQAYVLYPALCRAMGRSGDAMTALREYVNPIDDSTWRVALHVDVAEGQSAVGDRPGARETLLKAMEIVDAHRQAVRDDVVKRLDWNLAPRDVEAGRQRLAATPDRDVGHRLTLMEGIASALHGAGRTEEARQQLATAEALVLAQPQGKQSGFMPKLAVAYADVGDHEGVDRILDLPSSDDLAAFEVAIFYAEDDLERASQIAVRKKALIACQHVAAEWARKHGVAAAEKWVRALPEPSHRGQSLLRLVEVAYDDAERKLLENSK